MLLSMLRRLVGAGRHGAPDDGRTKALETHVSALYDHVHQITRELQTLRQDEARRAAEHSAMVDQLTRLYKRVSARIVREAESAPQRNGETDLDFRRRIGR